MSEPEPETSRDLRFTSLERGKEKRCSVIQPEVGCKLKFQNNRDTSPLTSKRRAILSRYSSSGGGYPPCCFVAFSWKRLNES